MVRIRLQRYGRRNRPYYRICAIDQRSRREGPVLENLGHYDPVAPDKTKQLLLNTDRVKHWLAKGAQPTETVRDMLGHAGLIDTKEWNAQREHDRKKVAERAAKAAAAGEKKEEAKA